jgi:Cft2 family RNA processing exonuclease
MKFNIINSSSKGNCLIIEDKIALDCGVTFSKLKSYVQNLKIVCLTHSHSDHFNKNTIRKLAKERPTLKFICSYYLAPLLIAECKVDKKNIIVLESNKMYDLGLFKCKMYDLYHDVPNVAYYIEYDGYKVFYATDTQKINHISEPNCDYYFIEANYNEDILKKHIEECDDDNKLFYLNRVSRTHLSETQAVDFLLKNMGDNSKYCYIHKSSYNFDNQVEERGENKE